MNTGVEVYVARLLQRIDQLERGYPPGYVRCCCTRHQGEVIAVEAYLHAHGIVTAP